MVDEVDREKSLNIKYSLDHQKRWRDAAWESFEFRAGRQYTDDELAALEEDLRPAIVFNRISPVIDSVHGHHINNETDIKIVPRGIEKDPLAQIYTQAMKWVDDECDAKSDISEAFLDCIITGIGFVEVYMSYDDDPDGQLISASHVPTLEMGWDPKARKSNINDARWIFRRRWWDRKDAAIRWPEIKNISGMGLSGAMDEFGHQPHDAQEAWKYENDQIGTPEWYDRTRDQLLITQYQYWKRVKVYRVEDPRSGRIIELNQNRFDKIKKSLDAMNIRYIQQMKKAFYQCFMVGETVIEENPLPTNSFTFLAITGKRDNNRNLWQGVVEGMKDPQRWSNKFFAEIQDFMSANRRGGAFAELDAFENPREAEEKWNDHGALILLNPGGLGKIQERNAVAYPSGLDRLMQIAISAIPDTSGINLEMMGLVDRNQPGILEQQRKQSAITILSPFFSSLRKFQRNRAKLCLEFIREFMADGRLMRVMDEGMMQYVPLVGSEQHDLKYDIIVDEAPHSPNAKQETFTVLMNLLPSLSQLGMRPPPSLPKYLPLPKSLVDEWTQAIQSTPPDQTEQARAQKAMSESELAQAKAANEQSEAQLNMVKAQKAQADTALAEEKLRVDVAKFIAENRQPK